jgi:DNA-binding CsgD family transcriptional regulator
LNESSDDGPQDKLARSLFDFVIELMRLEGLTIDDLPPAIRSRAREEAPQSPWIDWATYIAAIDFLGERRGAEGIARSMRAARPQAYAEIRTLYRLFRDSATYFRFFNEQVMSELNPCVSLALTALSPGVVSIVTTIADRLEGSRAYHEGTKVLIEIFPTHLDLPEASVEVVSMDGRRSELIARFPASIGHEPDRNVPTLTPRETEVLRYVCDGLTNGAIAEILGTSRSTVKNQISAILGKVGAMNRTELVARVSRSS